MSSPLSPVPVDCGRPASNAPVCAVKLVAQQEAFDGICDKFWCHRRDRRRHPRALTARPCFTLLCGLCGRDSLLVDPRAWGEEATEEQFLVVVQGSDGLFDDIDQSRRAIRDCEPDAGSMAPGAATPR